MAPSVLRTPRLAVTTLLLASALGPPARAEPPAAGEAAHERARKQGENSDVLLFVSVAVTAM